MCSDGMLEQMTNEELIAILSSEISDEEKRQRLINATVGNSDNHTAWLLHVETVTGEVGDVKTDEEMTSPCNAINIKPQREFPTTQQLEQEVEIAEHDDVEIVGGFKSQNVSTSKSSAIILKKRKAKAMALVTLLALLIILFFLLILPKGQRQGEIKQDRVETPTIIKEKTDIRNDVKPENGGEPVTEEENFEREETFPSEISEEVEKNERESNESSFIRDIIEKLL